MKPHVSDEQINELAEAKYPSYVSQVAPSTPDIYWTIIAEKRSACKLAMHTARDLYEPLVTSQKDRIAALEEAIDKAAARFDGILGKMPSLSKMTATERISHDMYVANCRNEARALLTPKTTDPK